MTIKTKVLILLMALCLVDMLIPIPILGFLLISVVLRKPPWFTDLVERIYGSG